jgi:DNA replication and repair protein RecF
MIHGINTIKLRNFRNYESAEFVFTARKTFLLGANGIGKSNLLEAIDYLSILRSYRGASVADMICKKQSNENSHHSFSPCGSFAIEGWLTDRLGVREKLMVEEFRSSASGGGSSSSSSAAAKKRRLIIGSSQCRKSSEFINEFRVIPFAPEDRALASGSSGIRRRSFDMFISVIDREYLKTLMNYQRALSQRNCALKDKNLKIASLFEEELAVLAAELIAKRIEYSAMVEKHMAPLLSSRYSLKIVPRLSLPQSANEIAARYARNRENDLRRGATSGGPQQDDFEFILDGRNLRSCGSTGQHRLVTLMLKTAQFEIIRSASRNLPVVVMVDDVTGELDEFNKELFFTHISSADQIIFAGASRADLSHSFFNDFDIVEF